MMGLWDGSGISWTTCKQPAPHSRQITTLTPHHSIFTGWMLFLMPNQQCWSTEGNDNVEIIGKVACTVRDPQNNKQDSVLNVVL